MKNILYLLTGVCVLTAASGCMKDFLQKPLGGTTTIDSVFSTSVKAQAAIAQAYSESLVQGLPVNADYDGANINGMNHGLLTNISGEENMAWSWDDTYNIMQSGMTANNGKGNANNAESDDSYPYNYTAIRQDYLVMENIDKVSDMDDHTKQMVKAEMRTLIAYRYMGMFLRYGGVPIVSKSLNMTDSLLMPRAPLQTMIDTITTWCDQAAAILPDVWPDAQTGRLTKGAALEIKAKVLTYAARPLFNSASPYLGLGAHNNLICFGNADPKRWDDAAKANEDVLTWAAANAKHLINTGSPLADYGTATSTPNNAEVILAYKEDWNDANNALANAFNPSPNAGDLRWWVNENGLMTNFLKLYYKADGTDQTWVGQDNPMPYSDYTTKMNELEPRFKASCWSWGMDAWNNPNDNDWSSSSLFNWLDDACAFSTKYYYKAGSRLWFEYPLFRLAENYLNLAEAYNEAGQPVLALKNLNIIRKRAGLPDVTETAQLKLRGIIQREWAVEYFNENHRYFDVKFWKLPNIGTEIIGGPASCFHFELNDDNSGGYVVSDYATYIDKVQYTGFWSPKQFLDPFPQNEVNKGTLVQNPGY